MKDLNETLESLRVAAQQAQFDISDCNPNPELQFDLWMEKAIESHCEEANAFVLSTVAKDGKPRARVVLLKGIHEGKFNFFTNFDSAKGHEIEANAFVSMTFLWLPLQRQVRIEGTISKVAPEYSDDYFHKRPRGSQIGAIASPQSKKINSRQELEQLFKEVEKKYADQKELPRPSYWGGYAIEPYYYEFWQGRSNRLHDRISYEKVSGEWKLARLAP